MSFIQPVQCVPDILSSTRNMTQWVRVWDFLPPQGNVVPVWDGDYMYYAAYWEKDGQQFWIVSGIVSSVDQEQSFMKAAGEQVYPIHWMFIQPPPKGL